MIYLALFLGLLFFGAPFGPKKTLFNNVVVFWLVVVVVVLLLLLLLVVVVVVGCSCFAICWFPYRSEFPYFAKIALQMGKMDFHRTRKACKNHVLLFFFSGG